MLAAARSAGTRVVLGTGWGGLATNTAADDVFVIDEVPYERLFPHVAAVIHDGGAGTVAAAAAAGRPQVVCPFVADQPFWGQRLHQLGVATEPIDQRHLARTGSPQPSNKPAQTPASLLRPPTSADSSAPNTASTTPYVSWKHRRAMS